MKVLRFGAAPDRYERSYFDKLISELERPNVQQQKPLLDNFGGLRSYDTATTLSVSDYTVLADTTSAGFTLNLPAVPFQGQMLVIKKISSDSNTLTIDGNGKNIEGSAADLTTAATNRPTFRLQYNSANGWWLL